MSGMNFKNTNVHECFNKGGMGLTRKVQDSEVVTINVAGRRKQEKHAGRHEKSSW